jgi:hypothetical protein
LSSLRAWFLEDVVLFLGGSDGALSARVSANNGADFLDCAAGLFAAWTITLLAIVFLLSKLRTN